AGGSPYVSEGRTSHTPMELLGRSSQAKRDSAERAASRRLAEEIRRKAQHATTVPANPAATAQPRAYNSTCAPGATTWRWERRAAVGGWRGRRGERGWRQRPSPEAPRGISFSRPTK